MTALILWLVLITLARVGIMVIVAIKLTVWHHCFNLLERVGLGLAGGAAFLTIPTLWHWQDNPFEGWANAAFSWGVFLYLCGRMRRHYVHRRNNTLQQHIVHEIAERRELRERAAREGGQ